MDNDTVISSEGEEDLLQHAVRDELTERLQADDYARWGPHADAVCRFCRRDAQAAPDVELGAVVCACPDAYSYAHRACLHEHVFATRAMQCAYCRETWTLDWLRLQRIAKAGGRVRVVRGVRQVGTVALAAAVLLAAVLLWAYVLKGAVWVATGTAAYPVFGVAALAVEPGPCPGDLVVGGLATLLSAVGATGVYAGQKWLYRRRARYRTVAHQELEAYDRDSHLAAARARAAATLAHEGSSGSGGRELDVRTRDLQRAAASVILSDGTSFADDDDDLDELALSFGD